MKTFQVGCPKCDGQLNSIAPLSGRIVCPFCGTVYHVTANLTVESEAPEQFVPFATSSDDFEQSALNMLLAEEYAPANLSEIISFDDAKSIYLPVYLYQGQYECAWSRKVKQVSVDTDAKKNRKGVYRSQNGVSKGEYAIVCSACEDSESGKALTEYVGTLDDRGAGVKPLTLDALHGHLFLTRGSDAKKTWAQRGKETLDHLVRNNTLLQLPSNEVKDFKCSMTSELNHEGRFMFYPVWMLNYKYDDQEHHIFMEGCGRNGVKGTTLIDHALKVEAEKPFAMLKYISVAAVVIPLLMLLAGWTLPAIVALIAMGLVFFGYRFYAQWFKNKVIRKARKKFKFKRNNA